VNWGITHNIELSEVYAIRLKCFSRRWIFK